MGGKLGGNNKTEIDRREKGCRRTRVRCQRGGRCRIVPNSGVVVADVSVCAVKWVVFGAHVRSNVGFVTILGA